MKKIIVLATCLITNLQAAEVYIDEREFADNREYGVREVGTLLWQERNASFPVKGSLCHGGKTDCPELGRLYTLEQSKQACDKAYGWRVATDSDWMVLEKELGVLEQDLKIDRYLGKRGSDEGAILKNDPYFGFDQQSGFFSGNRFLGLNDGDDRSYFWSVKTDEFGKEIYFRRNLRKNTNFIHRFSNAVGDFAISVRCVKDLK